MFRPDASAGARQALSVVNNQRGAEMGIFASSSMSAHFFSFPPGIMSCAIASHIASEDCQEILDVTGILEKNRACPCEETQTR